ncbi:MAG: hypothetical protein JWQ24_2509 [Tardiphaga sp.]|nr:hypothetical protein [Tardiphaga sp.]
MLARWMIFKLSLMTASAEIPAAVNRGGNLVDALPVAPASVAKLEKANARYFDGPKSSVGISICGMSIFTLVVSTTELSIQ